MVLVKRFPIFIVTSVCLLSLYYLTVYHELARDLHERNKELCEREQSHGSGERLHHNEDPNVNPELTWSREEESEAEESEDNGDPGSSEPVTTKLDEGEGVDLSKFLVHTPACTLPVSGLWPKYYTDDWDYINDPSPDCRGRSILATISQDELFLNVNESILDSNCSLYEVLRDPTSDNSFLLEYREPLNKSSVSTAGMEMMLLECDNKTFNIEATIPIKDEVERKLQHWEDKPTDEWPTNVLIIGFDSTSRMHTLRSLPKSMKILEELEFMDFKGFHSIGSSTLPNLLPLLMGLTQDGVSRSCSEDWGTPYDACPFIWKNFSSRDYVTAYLEDSSGTMNWGGQGGLNVTPTDYYIHPLFLALEEREEGDNEQCSSTESVPAFMLRYVKRFLSKFHCQSPFFMLNFMSYPFHDTALSLVTADEPFALFLEFLQTLPDFFSNTLVIIMGDHGDRHSFLYSDTQEAYLERSLPALFLRIPDKLQQKYPEFKRNAQENTERLTTCFDLHHTFLHMMSLTDPGAPSEFITTLRDRSSLFSPIPETRNCETVNIDPDICVCNCSADSKSMDEPLLLSRMVEFALEELNDVIGDSKYEPLCKSWERSYNNSLISATLLEEREGGDRIVLLRFPANPEDSQFSVNLRLDYKPEFWLKGNFNRISWYGDQSWCLGTVAEEDEHIRQLCYCTEEKPKEEHNSKEEDKSMEKEVNSNDIKIFNTKNLLS